MIKKISNSPQDHFGSLAIQRLMDVCSCPQTVTFSHSVFGVEGSFGQQTPLRKCYSTSAYQLQFVVLFLFMARYAVSINRQETSHHPSICRPVPTSRVRNCGGECIGISDLQSIHLMQIHIENHAGQYILQPLVSCQDTFTEKRIYQAPLRRHLDGSSKCII